MKCSDCAYCIPAEEYFQCNNENSEAYGLEIFDPKNAGCDKGSKTQKEEITTA